MKKGTAYVVSAISAALIIFLCDLISGLIVYFLYGVIENSNDILILIVAILLRLVKIIFFGVGMLAIIMICNALGEKCNISARYLCIVAGIFVVLVCFAIAFIAIEAGESPGTPSFYVLAALGLFGYGKISSNEGETQHIEPDDKVNSEESQEEMNNAYNEPTNTNLGAESEVADNVKNVVMDDYNSTSREQDKDTNTTTDVKTRCEEDAEDNIQAESTKTRYCKFCGGIIDSKTKKCTSCGKSTNPLRRMIIGKRTIVEIMALVLIVSVATGGYIAQKNYYESKMESMQDTISYKSKRITSLSADVKKYRDNANKYKDKADFMDDHIVIVADDGTNIYHSYGCSKLDTSSFWAFNTEAAKGDGYKPCSKCQ